ncbi:MAG: hypothetical protein ACE5HJ_06890 [Thermoplasmata archaeon]
MKEDRCPFCGESRGTIDAGFTSCSLCGMKVDTGKPVVSLQMGRGETYLYCGTACMNRHAEALADERGAPVTKSGEEGLCPLCHNPLSAESPQGGICRTCSMSINLEEEHYLYAGSGIFLTFCSARCLEFHLLSTGLRA